MLTRKEVRTNNSSDSNRLFASVWRAILQFRRDCDIDDVQALYEQISSQKVNDSKSEFYIYG